ncbi:hypothetical protein D9M69_701170 [compost metagenome]
MGVVAAAHQQAVRADLKIVAHAFLVRGKGALGCLVRGLVLGKPDVAVGAEDLARPEPRLQLCQERLERAFHRLLVHSCVRQPPLAVVVLLQLGVEPGCGGWNTVKCTHD